MHMKICVFWSIKMTSAGMGP